MEFQKIVNLLDINYDNKDLPKYVTKKGIEVYDQSEKKYNVNKEIRIKTSMFTLDLCDFSNSYVVVKGDITVYKKCLLLMILKILIIQQLMQLLLIIQIIMCLTEKS